jgi:hypothetical protein
MTQPSESRVTQPPSRPLNQSPEQPADQSRQRIAAAVAAVLLVLLGLVSLLPLRPSTSLGPRAAPDRFSAGRAIAQVEQFAGSPRPSGSPASAQAREHLLGALRGLDLSPTTDTRSAARSFSDRTHLAGTVTDIRATLPGRASTGRVLLVAHYDSVPTGPGASDDAANVAVLLEIVRALKTLPQQRNDVEVLFTDGEESGLLGAQTFVDSGAADQAARTVVLNLEARGTSGPAIMFQTVGPNSGLMPALSASGAVGTSSSDAVYQLLPNDTDLTVFGDAGMRGMNFAFVGDSANYHTAHDDLARVDPNSVQDMGEQVYAAARSLGQADLRPGGADTTYFVVLGVLVHYPGWLNLALVVVLLLGFLGMLWYARRHGVRLGRVALAATTFLLPLAGSAVIGVAGWYLLTTIRPEYLRFTIGDTYRSSIYAWGELCLVVVALLVWFRWRRRTSSALEISAAMLAWFTLLSVVCAALLPGVAYLFTWPALAGIAAITVALRRADASWYPLAGAVAAVPAVVLLLPVGVLLQGTLGISLSAAALIFAVLLAASGVTLLEAGPRGRALTATMLTVGVAAPVLVGVGLATDHYDSAHPRPVSLGYTLDADAGTATWLSSDGTADPVLGGRLSGEPVAVGDRFPNLGTGSYLSGPATVATAVARPTLDVLGSTEAAGVRSVRVRLRPGAGTQSVAVYADTSRHEIIGATVDGRQLSGGTNRPFADGPWKWGLGYTAPATSGVLLEFRVRGSGPLRIRAVAQSAGLPAEASPPTLPADSSWISWPSVAGQTFVTRTFQI